MATPGWEGARNGIIGDAGAMARSTYVNQLLGMHGAQAVYQGAPILTPNGTGGTPWFFITGKTDADQPFTMSGTTIGRVEIPLIAIGNGADLLVSLCADSSGVPGTVITQTRIPANWITSLGAVTAVAPNYGSFQVEYSGSPVAAPQFNGWHMGPFNFLNWPYPAVAGTGTWANPASTFYGSYIIQVGGVNNSLALNNVFTISYDTNGNLGAPIPQGAFPTLTDGSGKMIVATDSVTGDPVLVLVGGSGTFGGAPVGNTYTASFDPTTGTVAAWSRQTTVGYNVQNQAMATANGYVYVIGGQPGSNNLYNTVSYALVQNGQITSWNTATPLPTPTQLAYAAVIGNYLVVIGGTNYNLTPEFTTVQYAVINANGSLGPWVFTTPLPTGADDLSLTPLSTPYGIVVPTDSGVQSIGFNTSGPSWTWDQNNPSGQISNGNFTGYASVTDGQWMVYSLGQGNYTTASMYLTPMISVPLPTTGLTNGATYHILMQQQGGDLNNYMRMHIDYNTFPGNPAALTSARLGYSWSTFAGGASIPLRIYDDSVPASESPVVHLWEDSGARVSTLVQTGTPDQALAALCEAVTMTTAANSNTGFETSLTPWTVTGGTFTQSSTQKFEGQFAARIVPSGAATQVYITSEFLPCLPGQSITASCQVWFTNAVTTNFSMSVNWYTSGHTLISTTTTNISVSATTWTNVTNVVTAVSSPSLAYYYTLQPMLSGTPAAGQIWYVDNAIGYPTAANAQQSTVAALEYASAWPVQPNPIIGTVEIA